MPPKKRSNASVASDEPSSSATKTKMPPKKRSKPSESSKEQSSSSTDTSLEEASAAKVPLPVLKTHVSNVDDLSWAVDGGDFEIELATSSLTAQDKEAICEALEDLEICFKTTKRKKKWGQSTPPKSTTPDFAYGDLDMGPLGALMEALPSCAKRKPVPAETVVLTEAGRLMFFFDEMPSRFGLRAKVFGHVVGGMDAMEGRGCPGDADCHATGKAWNRFECPKHSRDSRQRGGFMSWFFDSKKRVLDSEDEDESEEEDLPCDPECGPYVDCYCFHGKTISTSLSDVSFLE